MTDRGSDKRIRDNGFMSGVVVLSLSAVIVKIIGLVYKIPMLKLLGSEGMGYFNSAYEIYTLFCIIATTGLPVAMSVMISSEKGGAERIFRVAMRLFLLLGVVGSAVMIGFARPFSEFLGSDKTVFCIFAIAPTVFLICLSSAYRGFFQGHGRMVPTAVSQVIEALGKLLLGLLFAFIALRSGYSVDVVAAFAVLGLTLGTAVSVLYLMLSKRSSGEKATCSLGEEDDRGIAWRLMRTAIPVTLSAAVISLTKVIDMTMILRRLQDLGYESEVAFSAYGNYTTLALPLFSLAPALIASVAMPLIPSLSRAVAMNDAEGQGRVVSDALKLTSIVSMPIAVGLSLFAKPILELVFSGESEAISEAYPLLVVLGLSVTSACLITVSNAILQAYSKAYIPIISMAVGSLVKIVLAYFLIGNSEIGILGAPISTFFCDLIINAVNFYCISRVMPRTPSVSTVFLMPFTASAVAVILARVAYNALVIKFGESALLTLACVAIAAILYLPLIFIFKVVKKEEISDMPILNRLSSGKNK
ncbi:MAG: polysaccharide biosynthesis protein [Ruminococcaceae bacterium]|nr:polysaccharide biosynthesis protein [Oscillospiraceae bacterium]